MKKIIGILTVTFSLVLLSGTAYAQNGTINKPTKQSETSTEKNVPIPAKEQNEDGSVRKKEKSNERAKSRTGERTKVKSGVRTKPSSTHERTKVQTGERTKQQSGERTKAQTGERTKVQTEGKKNKN